MIDEMLGQLFGEAVFGRLERSRRAQLLFRMGFGLLGTVLGVAGAVHFSGGEALGGNAAMRACMVGLMLAMACFWLFNVALGRKWKWPGLAFVAGFVGLIASRLLFGA